ncbi:MAG: hypothetical protein Q9M43_13345 [Sulfurimonas sp.]|nr:hypothetical protein [Sulfurimonas sp.]
MTKIILNNKSINYNIYIWFIYFVSIFLMAIFFSNGIGKIGSIFSGIVDLLNNGRYGDPKYFLTAAIDIAENGWITPRNDWIFNLWPPGFAILESSLIFLFGKDLPLILFLQILSSILYASILLMIFNLFKEKINTFYAFLLPLTIFMLPISRDFLLGQIGVSFGETFSIGFFLLFLLFSIKSLKTNLIKYAVYSGFFLGLSCYFRSYFETLQVFLTIMGIAFVLIIFGYAYFKKIKLLSFKKLLISIATILIVSNLLMLPWRVYHQVNQNMIKWVGTADLMFQNQLRTSDSFVGGAEWLLIGGANTACRVDVDVCNQTEDVKKLVIKTWLFNPLEWYRIKFEIIDEYWFANRGSWTSPSKIKAPIMNKFADGLILIFIIISIGYLMINKNKFSKNNLLIAWIYLSLLLSYAAIYTFAHFEVRYFYFPKILSIVIFLIIISETKLINNKKKEI